MKTIMKSILVFAAGALLLGSCAKWTETESLPFEYATLESKNPQLWESYLSSLREYHATEHQVLIVKFDNKEAVPSGRADHLTCLPDSVDFVILNNAATVNEVILSEVAEIRKVKGTRSLVNVSYDEIRKSVENAVALEGEAVNAEFDALEAEDQTARWDEYQTRRKEIQSVDKMGGKIGQLTKEALALVEPAGVDGINVIFNGVNPVSLNDEKKERELGLQEPFFTLVNEWIAAHTDALLFFEGTPAFILPETDAVSEAAYIIIPALSVVNEVAFEYAVNLSLAENVPSDRFVIGVTAIDITDPANTNGTFSKGTAITGAAEWAVKPATGAYQKAGVCVDHAQFDYYDITRVYSQINKAISIMNPSPAK